MRRIVQEKRVKDRGYLIATHWARGSVDWICDTEPWSMRTTQRDVVDLQNDQEFTSTLSEMIGAAVWWEGRLSVLRAAESFLFSISNTDELSCVSSPRLLEQHYASDWGDSR